MINWAIAIYSIWANKPYLLPSVRKCVSPPKRKGDWMKMTKKGRKMPLLGPFMGLW